MVKPLNLFIIAIIIALSITVFLTFQEKEKPIPVEKNWIEDWLTIGPFTAGYGEGFIDDLYEHGGIEKIEPKEGMEHSSLFAVNGTVRWKQFKANSTTVEFSNPDVDWDMAEGQWGNAGNVYSWYGYAEYIANNDTSAIISAEHAGGFFINGKEYFGDPYAQEFLLIPVQLKKGANKILVKATRGSKFYFGIRPVAAELMLNATDAIVPDIIINKTTEGWAAIPIINTGSKTIKNARLIFGDNILFEKTEIKVPDIAPFSIMKVPFFVKSKNKISKFENKEMHNAVALSYNNEVYTANISFRVRQSNQSYHITFHSSTDLSVQKYAVLEPSNFDKNKDYSLIVTLHGAGVDADGLINDYTKKDWAFIVAPTNTRGFGFSWQDWGRLNMVETVKGAMSRFPIDENKVYLTGHSMGGHGTWHNAFIYPDMFAAFGPSAGWSSFQYYTPFTLRKSSLYAPPSLNAIFEKAVREDNTPLFVENALNLPTYIIQGGKDQSVPPMHARLMVSLAKNLANETLYWEEPGAKHYFDNPNTTIVEAVDWVPLMEFFKSKERTVPNDVVFLTTDIGQNNRAYWVQIDEMEVPYEDTKIEAHIKDGKSIDIKATNVGQISLDIKDVLNKGAIRIKINGQMINIGWDGKSPVILHKESGKYMIGPREWNGLHKTPEIFGPMKQAYFSPFIFVYGTSGGNNATEINLQMAVYDANYWMWRGNGYVQIIPDHELTKDMISGYNLILYGSSETNSVTNNLQDKLPIDVSSKTIKIGDKVFEGDLAAKFIYPNPENENKFVLVIEGTGNEGMKLAGKAKLLGVSLGYPDFIVFDKSIETKGWGSFLAAGFFDNEWKISDDPRLSFFSE